MKSLAPRARKAVATIATRVFNRKTETKYVGEMLASEPTDIYASTLPTGGIAQLYDCVPQVSVGDEEFERNGVKIQPTKHSVDLDFRFNERAVTASPAGQHVSTLAWDLIVHVWYGYARRFKAVTEVTANQNTLVAQHLEDGQGNNVAWTGGPLDDFNRLNKEVMVLKHKSFRMYRPQGDQNDGTGIQQTYYPQVIRKRMTLGFKPPKTLLYNDNVAIPDNYAPFIIVGYQHADGTAGSTQVYNPSAPALVNIPALQMSMKNHLWFKDA